LCTLSVDTQRFAAAITQRYSFGLLFFEMEIFCEALRMRIFVFPKAFLTFAVRKCSDTLVYLTPC
jgi:hypothetical protein